MQKPNTKVAAGGLAGGLSMIIIWLLGQLDVDLPAEVAAAITTLVTFAVGYFVPEKAAPSGSTTP